MVDSIEALYREYRERLGEVDSIERELLETDDKAAWTETLVKKSDLIRSFYRDTEKELDTYINPILDGDEELTEENAEKLYQGAFSYYNNVLADDVMESQMLVKLWEYFHGVGNDYRERNCRFAFSDNPFFCVEGSMKQVASEQADWVSSYIDRIDTLREEHQSDKEFFAEVKHIMEANRKQYHMESVKYEPDVNALIRCFNRLSQLKKYKKYYDDTLWEEIQKQYDEAGTDVLFIAAMNWQKVDEDKKKQFKEVYPAAFLEQTSLPREQRNQKKYTAYLVYAFYSGILEPEETYSLLRAYMKSMNQDYDFNSPNWFQQPSDSKFAFYCHCFKPMLEMLARTKLTKDKLSRVKAGLFYELKVYIETIPRACQCKEYLDQALYHMLYDLIPFVEGEDQAIELIDTMIISRQLSTLIHSVMTAKLSKRIAESVLAKHPSFFKNSLGLYTMKDVEKRRDEILRYCYNGARVHDIGKILISNIINMQIRQLSETEHSYIKYHPKWSYDILTRNPGLSRYADMALGHHKSYDGQSGYPEEYDNTRSSHKIFIDILTIADCLDAATDMLGRNYARGKSFDEVVSEMVAGSGTLYHPSLVELLTKDGKLYLDLKKETSVEARIETYYHIYRKYR